MERQREHPVRYLFRDRQTLSIAAVAAEEMYRRVVDARLDSPLAKPLARAITFLLRRRQRDRKMVRRYAAAAQGGDGERAAREVGAVTGDEPGARGVQFVEPRELNEPHRRPRLVEPVVETELDDVVAGGVSAMAVPRRRRHPVRAKEPCLLRRLLVAKDRHASL